MLGEAVFCEAFGSSRSVRTLPKDVRGAIASRAEENELPICRPHRRAIEGRVLGHPRRMPAHEIPDPDIELLVADVERQSGAIRRDPRVEVRPRRRDDRLLLALPIDPTARALTRARR